MSLGSAIILAMSSGREAVDVEQLLLRRQAARERRDFATADAIRDRLTAAGILVEDTPDGARWELDTDRRSQGRHDGR